MCSTKVASLQPSIQLKYFNDPVLMLANGEEIHCQQTNKAYIIGQSFTGEIVVQFRSISNKQYKMLSQMPSHKSCILKH